MISQVLRHIIVVTASIPLTPFIESAVAASSCSNINFLIDAAPGNSSDITVEPSERLESHEVMLKLEGSADCAIRRLMKSKSYVCTWEFRHRDADAYAKFEALSQELLSCIGDRATLSDDQSVNRPDFYDSHMFLLDKVKVAVSVKDKSALGSTFIFVFVGPRGGT